MHVISLLRKSKLVGIATIAALVSISSAVLFYFLSSTLFPLISIFLLSVVAVVLVTRIVQLEWQVATLVKSGRRQKSESSARIDALGVAFRKELTDEIRRISVPAVPPHNSVASSAKPRGAASVQEKSKSAPVIGRLAAGDTEAARRQSELFSYLNQGLPTGAKTPLLGIMSSELQRIMSREYDLSNLSPSIAREQIAQTSAEMIVIDQRAFERGSWYGASSASGALLFAELSDSIKIARHKNIPVWYISTGTVPSPFSNDLEKMSTGVFGHTHDDTQWGEDLEVKFVHFINEYVSGVRR